MSAEPVVYLDSSALVKLVVREPESAALRSYLRSKASRVSSALARIEVVRAVAPHGPGATARARQVLEATSLLALDDALLDAAGALEAPDLRSLDAIHLAAAVAVEPLRALVTYDRRLSETAASLGLDPVAPS
jgi:predicted nucleic acid-binding protein